MVHGYDGTALFSRVTEISGFTHHHRTVFSTLSIYTIFWTQELLTFTSASSFSHATEIGSCHTFCMFHTFTIFQTNYLYLSMLPFWKWCNIYIRVYINRFSWRWMDNIAVHILYKYSRYPKRQGGTRKLTYFFNGIRKKLYIFWRTPENRNIVGNGNFLFWRTDYGKVPILRTLILLKK